MQPRQRSKCFVTVSVSAIVPSRRASIRWMRPRGESISSCQRTYVGHVGKQKPQWTQSDVSSRIIRREFRSGRTHGGLARATPPPTRRRRRRAPGLAGHDRRCTRCRRLGEPQRRGLSRARRRAPRARIEVDRGRNLGAGETPARPPRLRCLLRRAPSSSRAGSPPPAASPRTARRPDRGGAGRARSARPASRAVSWRSVAVAAPSTTSVRDAFGIGCSRKLTRAMSASRPCDPQTRRPRSYPATFLTTFPPAFATVPSARTRVTPRTRSRGAPNRWRSGPGHVRREQCADRRVARRVERQALPASGELGVQRRKPDAGLDRAREITRLVLQDPVESCRREAVADAQPPALRIRSGEEDRRLLDARDARQRRSSRAHERGTGRAPRRRAAVWARPCRDCRALPDRMRCAVA